MTEPALSYRSEPELEAPRWTRESLEGLESGETAYRRAFFALLAPRRGWLRAWGDPTVLLLGQAAFERWQRTGSTNLADYAAVGHGLEPLVPAFCEEHRRRYCGHPADPAVGRTPEPSSPPSAVTTTT